MVSMSDHVYVWFACWEVPINNFKDCIFIWNLLFVLMFCKTRLLFLTVKKGNKELGVVVFQFTNQWNKKNEKKL